MQLQKKLKLLYILDFLKKTDEQHPITTNQIVSKLQSMGIDAERKSVLRDIHLLKEEYGCEIELSEDNRLGYYMSCREFEDWEVKLLCDAAAGAQFLTESDRRALIDKLCDLTGEAVGNQIKRTALIRRADGQKGETKRNIDVVMRAIAAGKKVSFQYTVTKVDKQEDKKRTGLEYCVSPYALAWKDNAYLLFGNYEGKDNVSVYRLDRMRGVKILEEAVYPLRQIYRDRPYEKLREHMEKSVYNYGGETVSVTLKTNPAMLDAIRDQFGDNFHAHSCDGGIEVVVQTVNSDGLYFWLMKYGLAVRVLKPEAVRKKVINNLKIALNRYYKEGASYADENASGD